jgi:hypothetical protein
LRSKVVVSRFSESVWPLNSNRDCESLSSTRSLWSSLSNAGFPGSVVRTIISSLRDTRGTPRTSWAIYERSFLNNYRFYWESGAPGESRTPDLLVRSQTLYPAELRARRNYACSLNRLRYTARDFNSVHPRLCLSCSLPLPSALCLFSLNLSIEEARAAIERIVHAIVTPA